MEDARTGSTPPPGNRELTGHSGPERASTGSPEQPAASGRGVTYGARIVSCPLPDSAGELGEVTLGLADLAAYEKDHGYLGACVGRYANRIAGGRFVLDDRTFEIPTNEPTDSPVTTLHGGRRGFDAACGRRRSGSGAEVRMRRVSPDGEMGFPGDLDVTVTYRVEDADLRGGVRRHDDGTDGGQPDEPHVLQPGRRRARSKDMRYASTPTRSCRSTRRSIPTGELLPVDGTAFDLRCVALIGVGIRSGHPQLVRTRGYDHTYVLDVDAAGDDAACGACRRADVRALARAVDRPAGRPALHSQLPGRDAVGRDGATYRQTDAFCLEPQGFPDSPNHPAFPSTVLRPGETYSARDIYRFG